MAKKQIANLDAKVTPIDADNLLLADSADSNKWKKFSFASLRTWVTTFFTAFKAADNTFTGANVFPTMNIGSGNTVSGVGAMAQGEDCTASATGAHAEGGGTASAKCAHAEGGASEARLNYQHAQAGGKFAVVGDAQDTKIIQHKETTDATPVECLTLESERYVLPAGYIMACTVSINGSNVDGSVTGFYKRQALIKNVAGAVALIGSVQTIGTDITIGAIGGIAITADDANDSLKVEVTGKADETIRWVCVIDALEVGH